MSITYLYEPSWRGDLREWEGNCQKLWMQVFLDTQDDREADSAVSIFTNRFPKPVEPDTEEWV